MPTLLSVCGDWRLICACAPASKLYFHEQWLKEAAHIDGTQYLKRHPLYRAMDFLEANKEAIEQANLQTLSKGGGKYLLAMPMRCGDEVTEEILSRPGRYRSVAENLQVKEDIVGEGERK